jgi:hypothetical protein
MFFYFILFFKFNFVLWGGGDALWLFCEASQQSGDHPIGRFSHIWQQSKYEIEKISSIFLSFSIYFWLPI